MQQAAEQERGLPLHKNSSSQIPTADNSAHDELRGMQLMCLAPAPSAKLSAPHSFRHLGTQAARSAHANIAPPRVWATAQHDKASAAGFVTACRCSSAAYSPPRAAAHGAAHFVRHGSPPDGLPGEPCCFNTQKKLCSTVINSRLRPMSATPCPSLAPACAGSGLVTAVPHTHRCGL